MAPSVTSRRRTRQCWWRVTSSAKLASTPMRRVKTFPSAPYGARSSHLNPRKRPRFGGASVSYRAVSLWLLGSPNPQAPATGATHRRSRPFAVARVASVARAGTTQEQQPCFASRRSRANGGRFATSSRVSKRPLNRGIRTTSVLQSSDPNRLSVLDADRDRRGGHLRRDRLGRLPVQPVA